MQLAFCLPGERQSKPEALPAQIEPVVSQRYPMPTILSPMNDLTIAAFQKHIRDRYEKVDRERGTPKTFVWLIEEVGELATAINGNDRANLEEEFADVIAWLCTLANINDVDLSAAIAKKYLSDAPPEGTK